MRVSLLLGFAVAALPATADAPRAHPHGWIDVQTAVLVDDAGRIEALRQAWLFDELYSAFILDEFEQKGVSRDAGLARLLEQDVSALAPHDYFTRFEVGGEAREFEPVRAAANGVAAGRIWLRFDLPLARPVDPAAAEVRYAVYDPTYFIELLHLGAEPVELTAGLAERCEATIVEPEPPAEIVSLAALLDRTAASDDGLGAHFAQWVELRCDPPR